MGCFNWPIPREIWYRLDLLGLVKSSHFPAGIVLILISRLTSTWMTREMRRCRCQGDDEDAGDDDAGDDGVAGDDDGDDDDDCAMLMIHCVMNPVPMSNIVQGTLQGKSISVPGFSGK